MPVHHSVKLKTEELLRLDGVVSQEVQSTIDLVKDAKRHAATFGLTEEGGMFLAAAMKQGRTTGRLVCEPAQVRFCQVCHKGGGYVKFARDGRNHRKGDNDTSKPLMLSGVDLGRGFITFIGWPSIGGCNACWDALRPHLVKLLEGQQIEVHPKITGHASRWKRWDHMRCKCGWEGHEGEMGRLPTLMGDGYYQGKCPKCGAENVFLARSIERIGDGFTMVPVPIPWCELPEGLAALAQAAEKGKAHAEAHALTVKDIHWENAPTLGWMRGLALGTEEQKHEKELLGAFNRAVYDRWAELQKEARGRR